MRELVDLFSLLSTSIEGRGWERVNPDKLASPNMVFGVFLSIPGPLSTYRRPIMHALETRG